MTEQRLRVAAYAVCAAGSELLLARYVSPDGSRRHWTLPGGGVEHGEDPYDAVVREVAEETGYQVAVRRLLGVDSLTLQGSQAGVQRHRVAIFYRVQVIDGQLRHEADGTTDLAAWVGIQDVPQLERSVVIDTGLALERTRPSDGRVDPVQVGGLVRY